MKYPKQQFNVLVKTLQELNKFTDVKSHNPHALHFTVFQQFSQGQTHNRFIVTPNGELTKSKVMRNGEVVSSVGEPLIDFAYDFKLYPEGCNDNHIGTAMKNALVQVLS